MTPTLPTSTELQPARDEGQRSCDLTVLADAELDHAIGGHRLVDPIAGGFAVWDDDWLAPV